MITSYSKYQCSLCRRKKDILTDNKRVSTLQCIITKGCNGILQKISESAYAEATPSVSGLDDWYPRGETRTSTEYTSAVDNVSLSTAESNIVTIAVLGEVSNSVLQMKFKEKRFDNIKSTVYSFSVKATTNTITGKDLNNKILRFDQTAIDENRIDVKINGVDKIINVDYTLSPSSVSSSVIFADSIITGSRVVVTVYAEKLTIDRLISFISHSRLKQDEAVGAWGNVNYINVYNATTNTYDKYYLFSSRTLSTIRPYTQLKLDSIISDDDELILLYSSSDMHKILFLMASSPFENPDRYFNFTVPASSLTSDYVLSTVSDSPIKIEISKDFISEIYPPFHIEDTSLVYNESSSYVTQVQTDDLSKIRLTGKKIIGPI